MAFDSITFQSRYRTFESSKTSEGKIQQKTNDKDILEGRNGNFQN